jgi:hypothetical protein
MGSKRPDPDWKSITDQLWSRCDGFCEVSGRPLDYETFDRHHRRPKGMGGTYRPLTDSLVNLLALDPEVHNGAPWSVHQRPSWSRPRGYLLSSHAADEVLEVSPLLYRGREWVLLCENGQLARLLPSTQRSLSRKLEAGHTPATRPRGSQYR